VHTQYMAKVGDAFADSDGDGLEWFKIDEAGLLSGTVNAGSWGLGEILKNLEWTTTIPANLAPGNYLIRVCIYLFAHSFFFFFFLVYWRLMHGTEIIARAYCAPSSKHSSVLSRVCSAHRYRQWNGGAIGRLLDLVPGCLCRE
jgi:hypothetical protein